MLRFILLLSATFIFSLSGFSQHNTFSKYDTLRGSLSPLRTCFDVHYYELNLFIDIEDRSIRGSNSIYFKTITETTTIQLDLFRNMDIDSICMDMHRLSFERDSNAFFVHFLSALKPNTIHSVTVYYQGFPTIARKAPWDGGWVFTRDTLERPWVGVACEGIGASLWWPLKDHLSDEPDSMRMTYTVPASLMAVGNGVLEKTHNSGADLKSYTWKVNYPINSYNVTCNIAHYTHLNDQHVQLNKDTLGIDYYVIDYNKERALKHFKQVQPMLTCYEYYFGSYPFPKDGYAMVETPYWGMEHQGAIAYGNNYSNQIIDFDYIIIHESAHEWWGNNISTPDHAEMWIHESFTTYAENLLVEYFYGYDMSVRYLNFQKSRIENKDPIIGPAGVNYDEWQGSDMYYKGAWILHSFRNTLRNDSLWFTILKGIQTEFALITIDTDTIIQYINRKSGKDYTWFFKQYLYNAEPPILEYYVEKHKGKIYIHYKWLNVNDDFRMPIYFYTYPDKKINLIPTKSFQVVPYERKKITGELFEFNSFYYLTKQRTKL